MFKIKKSTKKVAVKDPLQETNNNSSSQHFRPMRPQSVKLTKRNISTHQVTKEERLTQNEESQRSQTSVELSQPEIKVLDRKVIEGQVRRLSAFMFKDKLSLYGEVKKKLIQKVTDRSILRPELWYDRRYQEIKQMICVEIERMQKSRDLQKRCEQRQSRIGSMIEDRLARLSVLR